MPESKNVVDTLAEVSRVPKAEVNAIWEQVKANHARLHACADHDFRVIGDQEPRLGMRYRCNNCQGELDAINVSWYRTGRAHADAK